MVLVPDKGCKEQGGDASAWECVFYNMSLEFKGTEVGQEFTAVAFGVGFSRRQVAGEVRPKKEIRPTRTHPRGLPIWVESRGLLLTYLLIYVQIRCGNVISGFVLRHCLRVASLESRCICKSM